MKVKKTVPTYHPLGKGHIDVEFIPESSEEAKAFKSNPEPYLIRESPGTIFSSDPIPLEPNKFRIYFAKDSKHVPFIEGLIHKINP